MVKHQHVTLSHFSSKESTGLHKPCIPGLFPIPRVPLKVDQSVQGNNFLGIHLNVSQQSYSFELFDLKIELLLEGSVYL